MAKQMNLDEMQIQSVVEQVVRNLVAGGAPPAVIAPPARCESKGDEGIFDDLEEAIAAAVEAQRALEAMNLEQRRDIIVAIRRESLAHSKGLAQKTVEETGMGKVPHKIRKFEVVAQHTPGVEDLHPIAWTGDNGLTVVEMAPFGVVAAVTPSTHPVPTIVNNAISLIAAGNSAIFAPHPSAKNVSLLGLQMLNRAIAGAGGAAQFARCGARTEYRDRAGPVCASECGSRARHRRGRRCQGGDAGPQARDRRRAGQSPCGGG